MMDKSIHKISNGKPTIPQKPILPPKPNLKTLHKTSLFTSSSKVAQALHNFESGMDNQMALNYTRKDRRYSKDISQDEKRLGAEARLPCTTSTDGKALDTSSFKKSKHKELEEKLMADEINHQLAVDASRSGIVKFLKPVPNMIMLYSVYA